MNVTDVLEDQLLLGFQPAVLAELAAPAEEVGGQQDGGGETGLLGHPVGLQQVGLDLLVLQEGEGAARELKYQLYNIESQAPVLPCRLHSGMPLTGGGARCVY